ncbi:kinase family protein [Striga asiatica]|uniref:Kinase family protein n=1 Tax=Striga asiatica TaxID=4170 RepID=A0A5A7R5S8_STRAF|nr:kinase family protein [Striga asiatica]
MDPSIIHNGTQYSLEHLDENLGPQSLLHKVDASASANTSLNPSSINISENKPVRNFSIQTGEEFALEFVRDRVNLRTPFVGNISGDPSCTTGYLELKRILGISRTSSEVSSDISTVATIEKTSRESENMSTQQHTGDHKPLRSSSGASHTSFKKLKILCSFGGRILPRPSDGKLRYVGGETRIVRISRDITWRDFWEKMTAVYGGTHVIKYQLPGEDLDALISVSGDEDLQNMMEECNALGGEGSGRLRIFLFSRVDIEDAYIGLADAGVNSEMKYVVAVNGLEMGPCKGSSGNNLSQLDMGNVEKDIHTSNEAGLVVQPTASESSKLVLSSFSRVGKTGLQFYQGQPMPRREHGQQHPPQFGHDHPPYHMPSEDGAVTRNTHGAISREEGDEGKFLSSSGTQVSEMQEKEIKHNFNGLVQLENGINPKVKFPDEGSHLVPTLDRDFSSKASKCEGVPRVTMQVSNPLAADNPSKLPKSDGNEYDTTGNASGSRSIISESDPTDPSCSETFVHPQRTFYSERIPREQSGQLNRISKSDDSHSSQFLNNQDLVAESAGRFESGNVDNTSHVEPQTSNNGHPIYPPDAKGMNETQPISNDTHGHPQPEGDILIDINDRFPRDLLSDIFSKAILSDGSSGIGPLPKDGTGLSMNIESHEPQRWSFFQRLAGDQFMRRDVSLIDQDHMFSTKVNDGARLAYDFVPQVTGESMPSHGGLEEKGYQREVRDADAAVSMPVRSDYDASQVKFSDGIQDSELMGNTRIQESDYEVCSQGGFGKISLAPLDQLLVDFEIINSLQIIHNADLEELKELGSGTFGTVYHGKWRGSDVAIKRIKKSCFTGRQSEQERLTNDFWREAEILSKLHHPNVVAFYGVVHDGPGETLATVTEYMVDGSLRHALLRKDRQLDRWKRLVIAMDAAFGMEYLHSKNIVHFDLKCDNLLVNLKDPSRPICKVGDFGLSKIKRNTLVSGGVRGTLPWMAPELLNGSSNKVSEKVDVFSFGIVLWEILTGEEPYANMHYGAIIGGIVNNTLRPTIPGYCDPEWRRLMEQCWAPNPVGRPCFTEIASRLRVMSSAAQTRKGSS